MANAQLFEIDKISFITVNFGQKLRDSLEEKIFRSTFDFGFDYFGLFEKSFKSFNLFESFLT